MATANPPTIVGVASQSAVKIAAVQAALQTAYPTKDWTDKNNLLSFNSSSDIAEQPVGEEWGRRGARNRLIDAQTQNHGEPEISLWFSIENFVACERDTNGQEIWFDQAVVMVIGLHSPVYVLFSAKVFFPAIFAERARNSTPNENSKSGFHTTCGKIIAAEMNLPHDDWHRAFPPYRSRIALLHETLMRAILQLEANYHDITKFRGSWMTMPSWRSFLVDWLYEETNRMIVGPVNVVVCVGTKNDVASVVLSTLLADRWKVPVILLEHGHDAWHSAHHVKTRVDSGEVVIAVAFHIIPSDGSQPNAMLKGRSNVVRCSVLEAQGGGPLLDDLDYSICKSPNSSNLITALLWV